MGVNEGVLSASIAPDEGEGDAAKKERITSYRVPVLLILALELDQERSHLWVGWMCESLNNPKEKRISATASSIDPLCLTEPMTS